MLPNIHHYCLTNDDFYLQQGQKGPIMSTNIQGLSIVLFYSKKCDHCQKLIPIFKRLPTHIPNGIQFGMINVCSNKNVIKKSRQTISPITFVPYIVLYVNGKPYMRYNGPHDISQIARFIKDVSSDLSQKMKQTRQNNTTTDNNSNQPRVVNKKNQLPSYTIGNPLCGEDGVCYLEFDEAYV